MTHVSNARGEKLLCCWDDCGQYGHDEIFTTSKSMAKETAGLTVKDIYCSDRHRLYALAAPQHGNGKLLTGDKESWRY